MTNSAKILNELSESATIKLILIGGRLDRNSMSFIGPSAIRAMNQYHFDMAIVSCRSLALSGGIMDSNEQQAEIRSLALSLASQTILVADYTKLDRTAFCQIAPLTSINTLVVDAPLSSEWKDYLSKYDIAYEECISNVDDSVTENGG